MDKEERERFEQRLAGDPDLQTELELREGLRQLRWEEKVTQASTARKQWEKRRLQKNWLFASIFILGILLIVLAYKKFTAEPSSLSKITPESTRQQDSYT